MKIITKSLLFLSFFALILIGCEKEKESNIDENLELDFVVESAYPNTTGEVVEFQLNGHSLICEKINGEFIYQGDIVLTYEQLGIDNNLKGAALKSISKRWPNNTVYYQINSGLSEKGRITDAIEHLGVKTLLKFEERSDQENYIEFIWDENGCSSYLGMIGGKQLIKIADWAKTGNVVHEIGHAIGLIHEHSRNDRDDFIIIDFDNIIESAKHNYYKNSAAFDYEEFDFNSIMIYPPGGGFAIDSKKPIITKLDGSTYKAQRKAFSVGDVALIAHLCGNGTLIDSRDGNIYNSVKIGDQTWMAENLAYLPSVSPSAKGSETKTYYYVFDYQGTNVSEAKLTRNYQTYGVLYNWPAAMNSEASSTSNPSGVQGVCPTGWHLPSDAEWTELTDFLGGESVAGGKLKETGTAHWFTPNEGVTNETDFSALPGGYRYIYGISYSINQQGFWWSASKGNPDDAWTRYLGTEESSSAIFKDVFNKSAGFSVRCIKD
ncbi:MAG: hypothetical protein K9H49_11270 [Bacteroidales bacterium]|nr:hypothetical protein [Bacteroidales bacterium]MCF8389998.1 hypothetical protein [Bacteroidales bacterium]